MLRDLDQYYLNKEEPTKSCLHALRDFILNYNNSITEAWTDKKSGLPYIGFVEGRNINHALLEQGSRKRMKILRINPAKDLPIEAIAEIMNQALLLY